MILWREDRKICSNERANTAVENAAVASAQSGATNPTIANGRPLRSPKKDPKKPGVFGADLMIAAAHTVTNC